MEKQTDKKIQFKPLHEGMGFHPFSDGLPYAPESKSNYSQGAGATSAGRPQFVNPAVSSPHPMANKTDHNISHHVASKPMGTARQLQQRAPVQSLHTPIQQTVANPNARAMPAVTNELANSVLRRRVFAYLLDTVIHAGFWLATNLTALFLFKFQIDSEIVRDNFAQFFVFFCISQWMFVALQEMLFENSIGKVFFNLEFKRNHRSLLLRSMIFALGVICLGLGFYFRPQDKLGQIQLKSKIYSS